MDAQGRMELGRERPPDRLFGRNDFHLAGRRLKVVPQRRYVLPKPGLDPSPVRWYFVCAHLACTSPLSTGVEGFVARETLLRSPGPEASRVQASRRDHP